MDTEIPWKVNTETIKHLYQLKLQKEALEAQIAELGVKTKALDEEISKASDAICFDMKMTDSKEYSVLDESLNDTLVATFMSRVTSSYSDEALKYLDTNKLSQFLDVKTSIKKAVLNKELKTNVQLREALQPYIMETTTEYVVVTTKDKTERMKEHILESKK